MENKTKSPAPPAAVQVGGGHRQYLIAPRRHVLAAQAGVQPLSATELHAHVTQLPGVDIKHVGKGHKHSHHLSQRPDEAVAHYVVKLEPMHAQAFKASASGRVIVEEDLPLGYGRKQEAEIPPVLHPQSAMGPTAAPTPRDVVIRVQDKDGKPVPQAAVSIVADGPVVDATSDADGYAKLQILQAQDGPVSTLFVRPLTSYWNRYLQNVSLNYGAANAVVVTPLNEPNPDVPPTFSYGWGQLLMGMDPTAPGMGGQGIKVAIVDSGADAAHPFLRHVTMGVDLTNNCDPNTWRIDTIGHGSHCAGVIGARFTGTSGTTAGATSNAAAQEAMRGFVPQAELHALKIFPGGQFSSLVQALDYCIDNDIDVINLSLGAPQPSEAVEQKLIEAVHAGVAVFVAAGNSGGPVQFPARSNYVLAVAALGLAHALPLDTWEQSQVVAGTQTPDGLFAPHFSCFGPQIAVCGPGVGIISTVPGNAFASDSGTSMAAPHIAGLAALLLSDPQLAPYFGPRGPQRVAALFQLMRMICSPILAQDPDNRFGAGLPRLQNLRRLLGR